MTVRIGSNLDALKGQRSLGQASDRIEKVYQRLSTGQRINRASDDAAGLSIADALSAKSRVFTRGAQNVSDGLSALTIADSAVETLIQLTTRIQELAEQGANGSYSNRQRAALDKEAQSLRDEFLRIVQSTAFNGQRLLDGTVQGLQIQAGYGAEGAIASSVGGKLGTGSFNPSLNTGLSVALNALATGDLNGDGIQDVVTGNGGLYTSGIRISLGNGDGTFRAGQAKFIDGDINSVALSDLNGDGALDIVSSNSLANSVSVLLANGDGTFRAPSGFNVGGVPSAVVSADFNGDGFQDVAAANSSTHNVSILLGNGDGTLRSQQTSSVGQAPTNLRVGDFNGDGLADLVTADFTDNTVSVLIGNGNGTFQSRRVLLAGSNPNSVTTGDFNGDGRLDIVSTNSGAGTATLFLGNGNGTFKGASSTFAIGDSLGSVTTADLNGDGFQDLVTTASVEVGGFFTTGAVAVVIGNGNGTFQAASFLNAGSPMQVTTSDVNGDGVPDIVAADSLLGLSSFAAQTRDGVHPLLPISLKTQADSRQALSIVSKKLELLSAQRGVLGAAQSRLLSGARTLLSQRDEFLAANSRIRDADFAGETAELTRTQITQSAASAVMAQANQQPAIALKLLRI